MSLLLKTRSRNRQIKLVREILKTRKEASSIRTSNLLAIYFDNRKDETITKEIVAGKNVRKSVLEELISIFEEPVKKTTLSAC